MSTPAPLDARLQNYLRRSEKLQRRAWLFTALPLAVFVFLSVLVARKTVEYERLSQASANLQSQIQQQNAELDEQRKKNAVQATAIDIVKEQSPGTRPKVMVYRLAVTGQVKAALDALGYNVEQNLKMANPLLANKPVDTLTYGCAVREQDIRTVATALTKAGITIRVITRAVRNPERNLIQLVSNGGTTEDQPALTISQISAWTRPGRPCS
jgi:preprotein translocase subunit SecF